MSGTAPLARVLAAAAILAAAAVACAPRVAEEPGVIRTDSAGVRIVTSVEGDRPLAARLDSIGVLRDAEGRPWRFTGLDRHRVVVDRAGRTYVLAGPDGIVRFGRDGALERRIGAAGTGPGEFRDPRWMTAEGDSLAVWDAGKGAIVRFNSNLDPLPDRALEGAFAGARRIAWRTGGFWYELPASGAAGEAGMSFALRADSVAASAPLHVGARGIAWSVAGPRLLAHAGDGYTLWLHEGARTLASVRRSGAPDAAAVEDLQLLSDGTFWVLRADRDAEGREVVDIFESTGRYAGTVAVQSGGVALPLGRYPNGDLLVGRAGAVGAGELVLVRVAIRR